MNLFQKLSIIHTLYHDINEEMLAIVTEYCETKCIHFGNPIAWYPTGVHIVFIRDDQYNCHLDLTNIEIPLEFFKDTDLSFISLENAIIENKVSQQKINKASETFELRELARLQTKYPEYCGK